MRYESMVLAPDVDADYEALHEAIQDGWEVFCQWRQGSDGAPLIALRRRVSESQEMITWRNSGDPPQGVGLR